MPLHTKIEFSRRIEKMPFELNNISLKICQHYHLPPCKLSHYAITEAVHQKILVLAHRTLTQARDVFDLYHLMHIEKPMKMPIKNDTLLKAEESLLSIKFSDYQSQVVSFLEHDQQKYFNKKSDWDNLVSTVHNYLAELQ